MDNADNWDDEMLHTWTISDFSEGLPIESQTIKSGSENVAHVSGSEQDSDNNALPSNQEAFKNEGGSSVCQSKDLMLGHLHAFRAENELLRQQVNRLQSSVELLLKNQDTLINERRKDSAIIGLMLKNQNTSADHRRRDRQEN
ncbi:MAG: hypothetical protein ACRCZO_06350 [Cetobacterium sp.]